MKADSVFAILSAKIKKVDGSQAQHYAELAEEAARNAEADAAHIQESSAAIDALEETVGDENSGLVKDVSDAQGDISVLQDEAFDPHYYSGSTTLSLREHGAVPEYSYDDTKFIEITTGSYSTNYPVRIICRGYGTRDVKISNENTSKYFIGYLKSETYYTRVVIIEYNANAEFATPSISGIGTIVIDEATALGNFKAYKYRWNTSYNGGTMHKYLTNETWTSAYGACVSYDNYTAADAIAALNYSDSAPTEIIDKLRVDEALYVIKDTQARSDLATLETTVGDANSGLVKDVNDLKTTVGDANSGLVKDVDALEATVGDANSGLVKDVDDAQGDITELQTNELDVEYSSDTLTLRKNGELPTYVFDSSKFIDGTGKSPVAYGYLSNSSFDKNTASIYINNQRDDSLYFIGSAYKSGNITYIAMIEYSPTATFSLSGSNVSWGWYGGNRELVAGSYTDVGNYRVYIAGITNNYATIILFETYGVGPNIPMLNISDTNGIIEALALEVGLHKDPVSSIRVDSGYYEVVDQAARNQVAVNTTNIQTLGATVGDANSGLVKEVDDLGTQVSLNVTNIQTLSNAVDAIYEILQRSDIKPGSWSDTQKLVEDDLAKHIISVRDQFESGYGTNGTLLWDVLDINHDTPTDTTKTKSMTLQTHYVLDDTLAFSPREAFYAFTEAATAGKYYFTMGAQPWYADDVDKIFEFELTTSDIPSGAQLAMTHSYNATGDGTTVKLYLAPGNLTEAEAVTMNIVTEPTEGAVNLGTINRTKQNNLNCIDRVFLGNNNWKESLLRQWLNTDGAANTWWTAQNIWDRPASWVETTPGFMSYLDGEFKAVIGRTHVTTVRNTLCDGGGTDETDDYFFLISREEAYAGPERTGTSEGTPYAYYEDYAAGSSASTDADPNRVKTKKGSSSAQYWWYRTPNSGIGNNVRGSHATGALRYDNALYSIGVSPACNII